MDDAAWICGGDFNCITTESEKPPQISSLPCVLHMSSIFLSADHRNMEQQHNHQLQVDTISNLPDPLIHHIFSFLDTIEIVHTSILSNRWRSLWSSAPTLAFNFDQWLTRKCHTQPRSYYQVMREKLNSSMDFVDKVLTQRQNSNITSFNLYSLEEYLDPTCVSSWVNTAIERNVKSLKVFCSDIASIRLTMPWIESLDLFGIVLPDGNANGELTLSCPMLENLSLVFCDVDHLEFLTVSTPLLKRFKVHLSTSKKNSSPCVKVFSPNLESLEVASELNKYYSSVDYSFENDLSSLVSADINVRSSKLLIKILPMVYNVQYLKLSVNSNQVLTDFRKALEGTAHLFHNLRNIVLVDWIQEPSVYSILIFLESFPHLEALFWQRHWNLLSSWIKGDESLADVPSQNMLSFLKTVEIQNLEGAEVELEFLGFLLERATVVKEICFKYSLLLADEKLTKFKEKLSSIAQSSSSAWVSYQLCS